MTLEWNDRLATGNDQIDNQHKELIARFSNLLDACNRHRGKEEVMNLLDFLSDYVVTHFSMEEKLQQEHNYPGYFMHKAQHTEFMRQLSDLKSQFGENGATLSLVIKTNQTMSGWLVNHINETDRKLAEFLRGR